MTEATITLHGMRIRYQVEGNGPDVVFIHGWASSRRMWSHLTPYLADHYRCWAIDLPGCGDSDKPANGWYSISNYTSVVVEWMRARDLGRASVVGHSMGGMIALDLAAAHPNRVERLVAINPVVTGRRASLRPLAHWGPGRQLLDLTLRLSPVILRPVLSHPLGESLHTGVKFIRRRTEDFAKGTVDSIWNSGRAVVNYDVSPRLPLITAPTLVILGDVDLTVSNLEGELAAERIPGAELVVMPAGHLPTDDRPKDVVRRLRAFLS